MSSALVRHLSRRTLIRRWIAATVAMFSLLVSTSAVAQIGTADQSSPAGNTSYNGDAVSLTWQQQIKAGVSGQLEGITLALQGTATSQINVRIRLGSAPSAATVVFSSLVTKTAAGNESVFVDMTAANIVLGAGDNFVLEMQGNGTGGGIQGQSGAPASYPEPLFLNGSEYVNYRLAFTTYMGCTPTTACDDSDACTVNDMCSSGDVCAGTPVVCSPLDQCHAAGSCDPSTGACSSPPLTDGPTCDDANACTLADSCQAGVCTFSSVVVCAAIDECHDVGACEPSGDCDNPVKADGTVCSGGVCSGGVCGAASTSASATSGTGTSSGAGGSGAGGDSASGGGGAADDGGSDATEGGCSCRVGNGRHETPAGALGIVAIALVLAARRRRA